jgi:DNA-binding GntR family transcriptional regulator
MSTSTDAEAGAAKAGANDGSRSGGRADLIYASVFDAVVDQRLPPGTKLTEEQLASIFGVGRTIVRSALQALAHDHIVTIERNRGAFVSAPTIADAQDIFFARRLVESAIAREASRRIRPEEVGKLRKLLGEEREALRRGDRQASIRLSGAFHIAVARCCGDGALTRFLSSLISRSSLVIALYGRGAGSACGHDEHLEFVDALEAGEGARAEALMSAHLEHILANLMLTSPSIVTIDVAAALRYEMA